MNQLFLFTVARLHCRFNRSPEQHVAPPLLCFPSLVPTTFWRHPVATTLVTNHQQRDSIHHETRKYTNPLSHFARGQRSIPDKPLLLANHYGRPPSNKFGQRPGPPRLASGPCYRTFLTSYDVSMSGSLERFEALALFPEETRRKCASPSSDVLVARP